MRRTAIAVGDAHRALAPDEASPQVVAGLVGREAAEPGDANRRRSTTSSASTWVDVTPDARQCGPPALVATLPPIVHACCDDGSGA